MDYKALEAKVRAHNAAANSDALSAALAFLVPAAVILLLALWIAYHDRHTERGGPLELTRFQLVFSFAGFVAYYVTLFICACFLIQGARYLYDNYDGVFATEKIFIYSDVNHRWVRTPLEAFADYPTLPEAGAYLLFFLAPPFLLFSVAHVDGVLMVYATLHAVVTRRSRREGRARMKRKRRESEIDREIHTAEEDEARVRAKAARMEAEGGDEDPESMGAQQHRRQPGPDTERAPLGNIEDLESPLYDVEEDYPGLLESARHRFREGMIRKNVAATVARMDAAGRLYETAAAIAEKKKRLVLAKADLQTIAADVEILKQGKRVQLAKLKAKEADYLPSPTGLLPASRSYVVLGDRQDARPGDELEYTVSDEQRKLHFYAIGGSGSGKTTLLQNMMIQDMRRGRHLAFIDPHGQAAKELLSYVPQERIQDVIYLEPKLYPFGFNVLELTVSTAALVSCIQRVRPRSWGERMHKFIQHAIDTLRESPNPYTIADIPRLFVNADFRAAVLRSLPRTDTGNAEHEWWGANKTFKSDEVSPIENTFRDFLAPGAALRPIFTHPENRLDFDAILQTRPTIMLINLGGLEGEQGSLLGAFLVAALTRAALNRDGIEEKQRRPFYLYCDEFQRFQTDAFASIVSEARKFGLHLHLAHQYLHQTDDDVRHAVETNVQTRVTFTVSPTDAAATSKLISRRTGQDAYPSALQLQNLPKYQAFARQGSDAPVQITTRPLPRRPENAGAVAKEVLAWSRKQFEAIPRITEPDLPVAPARSDTAKGDADHWE